MLIIDILSSNDLRQHTILTQCSDFIKESEGLPMFRNLPRAYSAFHKVKVRAHKKLDTLALAFNNAFQEEFYNIAARSIVARSYVNESTIETEPFYVFPINGYKFLYNKEVQNSNNDLRATLETLQHSVSDAIGIASDVIKHTYTNHNLVEGINADAEIIFYNIPFYYAVKVREVDSYTTLINR